MQMRLRSVSMYLARANPLVAGGCRWLQLNPHLFFTEPYVDGRGDQRIQMAYRWHTGGNRWHAARQVSL